MTALLNLGRQLFGRRGHHVDHAFQTVRSSQDGVALGMGLLTGLLRFLHSLPGLFGFRLRRRGLFVRGFDVLFQHGDHFQQIVQHAAVLRAVIHLKIAAGHPIGQSGQFAGVGAELPHHVGADEQGDAHPHQQGEHHKGQRAFIRHRIEILHHLNPDGGQLFQLAQQIFDVGVRGALKDAHSGQFVRIRHDLFAIVSVKRVHFFKRRPVFRNNEHGQRFLQIFSGSPHGRNKGIPLFLGRIYIQSKRGCAHVFIDDITDGIEAHQQIDGSRIQPDAHLIFQFGQHIVILRVYLRGKFADFGPYLRGRALPLTDAFYGGAHFIHHAHGFLQAGHVGFVALHRKSHLKKLPTLRDVLQSLLRRSRIAEGRVPHIGDLPSQQRAAGVVDVRRLGRIVPHAGGQPHGGNAQCRRQYQDGRKSHQNFGT